MRYLESTNTYTLITFFVLLLILPLTGCATLLEMDVRSYSDPTKANELAQLRKFSLAPVSSFDPLKEKELLFLLKNKLVSKGYIYTDGNPDFIVSIVFYIDPVQVQGTTYKPVYTPGTTSTSSLLRGGGAFSTTTTPGQTYYVPVPYSDIVYHRAITVPFINPQGVPLWKGEVESTGRISDLLVVAPTLIDELLNEFPYKTGKENPRLVPLLNSNFTPWKGYSGMD